MSHISVSIEQLDEGFLVEEDGGKSYAISTGTNMIEKVREIFMLNASCEKAHEPVPLPESVMQEGRAKHLITDRVHDVSNDVTNKVSNIVSCDTTQFSFQECAHFYWQSVPEKRFGKTTVHQSGRSLRIAKEGYDVAMWVDMESLKRLKVLQLKSKKDFNIATGSLSSNKRTIIRTCLNEIDLSKLGNVDSDPAEDQEKTENTEKSARIERLREIAPGNWD